MRVRMHTIKKEKVNKKEKSPQGFPVLRFWGRFALPDAELSVFDFVYKGGD